MSLTYETPRSLQSLEFLTARLPFHRLQDRRARLRKEVLVLRYRLSLPNSQACGSLCFCQLQGRWIRLDCNSIRFVYAHSWVPITVSKSMSSLIDDLAITSILAKSEDVAFSIWTSDPDLSLTSLVVAFQESSFTFVVLVHKF